MLILLKVKGINILKYNFEKFVFIIFYFLDYRFTLMSLHLIYIYINAMGYK